MIAAIVSVPIDDGVDFRVKRNSEIMDEAEYPCIRVSMETEFDRVITYIQKTGRVRGEDDVIAYHLRQSFVPGEITPVEANRLGCELVKRFTKGKHAYIVCIHIDKSHKSGWAIRKSPPTVKGFALPLMEFSRKSLKVLKLC